MKGKDMDKVKIKITNGTIVNGRHATPGKVFTVDQRIARALFVNGKAVPVEGKPEKPMTRKKAKK